VQWRDDAFLTPVLADDPLLFGLEVEDEDIVMQQTDEGLGSEPAPAGQRQGGGDAEALRAENEALKLQVRARAAPPCLRSSLAPRAAAAGADDSRRGGARRRGRR